MKQLTTTFLKQVIRNASKVLFQITENELEEKDITFKELLSIHHLFADLINKIHRHK